MMVVRRLARQVGALVCVLSVTACSSGGGAKPFPNPAGVLESEGSVTQMDWSLCAHRWAFERMWVTLVSELPQPRYGESVLSWLPPKGLDVARWQEIGSLVASGASNFDDEQLSPFVDAYVGLADVPCTSELGADFGCAVLDDCMLRLLREPDEAERFASPVAVFHATSADWVLSLESCNPDAAGGPSCDVRTGDGGLLRFRAGTTTAGMFFVRGLN